MVQGQVGAPTPSARRQHRQRGGGGRRVIQGFRVKDQGRDTDDLSAPAAPAAGAGGRRMVQGLGLT